MKKQEDNTAILLAEYSRKRRVIRQRLAEFRAVRPEDYFYELCFCLMTPQSSAANALKAQRELSVFDFQNTAIDPEPLLHRADYYIRFHKTKARLLVEMKNYYPSVFAQINGRASAREKRDWLAANVKGLGLKEATHFLRNLGLNDGLAILDRHILRNLRRYGVIRSLPKTLTPKKYLAVETRFQSFARVVGIPIDELDLLFWSNEAGEILK